MADFNFYINRQGIRGLQGIKGDQGDSPIIVVQSETPNEYILKITNPDGTELLSPNLRGNKININEGTYVRYNTETGELYTSTADGATGELAGVVRLATDTDITDIDEKSAVTPSQLADALSKYLTSPDGSVKIVQNADTSLTELTTEGGLTNLPIASADTLGGVKIGENLTITADGTLSASASGGDVTAAGDNKFTGKNTFDAETRFNKNTWTREQETEILTVNNSATFKDMYVTGTLSSVGEISAVFIQTAGIKNNQNQKYYLDQASITAGSDNLIIAETDNGIKLVVNAPTNAQLAQLQELIADLSTKIDNLTDRVRNLEQRIDGGIA